MGSGRERKPGAPSFVGTRWGTPPWRLAGRAQTGSPPERCQVAVVGAGLTGLACGVAAARQGLSVVVLEGASVGAGASGRTGGIVLEGTAAGSLDGVSDCIPALERTVRDLRIECDLRVGTCWELVHRPEPTLLEDRGPNWSDEGHWLYPEGSVPGGTLHPGALLEGLSRSLLAAGGELFCGAAVHAIDPGPPARLEHPGGVLAADHVVLGLNGFTPGLLPSLASIRPALTLALSTEPLEPGTLGALGLSTGAPFYTLDLPYLWGRPAPDGGLIFGGGLAFDPEDDLTRIDVSTGAAAEILDRLEARVRALHPALGDVRIRTRWGGPVASRQGRCPILTRLPDAPNLIVTGAYAGHGVALAVRIGEIVIEAITRDRDLPEWGGLVPGIGH